MKAFIDLRDAKTGAVYVFDGKAGQVSPVPFTLDEGGKFKLEAPLPPAQDIYLGLPISMLGFRLLEFPFTGVEKIRHALPFELEGIVLKGLDEIVWDVITAGEAGEGGGAQKVLAIYTEKRALKGLLNALKEAGVEPSAVTSIELAGFIEGGTVYKKGVTAGEISEALLTPPPSADEERSALAHAEISRPKPSINLRAGELRYTKPREELGRRMKTAFVLAMLLLLVFSIKSAVGIYFLNKEARAIENRMSRSLTRMLPGGFSTRQYGTGNIQVSLMELEGSLAELRREKSGFFGGLPPLENLKKLSLLKAGGVVIREISMNGDGMVIKGEAHALSDVEAEKNAIGKGFSQVNVLETRNEPVKNLVLFTLKVKL